MKSLFTLLLGAFAVTSFGQGLNESFESGAFSDDWKVINTNDSYKWEVVAYAEENDLSRTISGFKSGGEFAVVSTTGYKKESESPDQWLISPALTVESGDVLNFMMGCKLLNVKILAGSERGFAPALSRRILVSTDGGQGPISISRR